MSMAVVASDTLTSFYQTYPEAQVLPPEMHTRGLIFAIAAAPDLLPADARDLLAVDAVPAQGTADTSHSHDVATLQSRYVCPLLPRPLGRRSADNKHAAPNRSLLAA